jgi:hypothetical protein
MAEGIEEAVGLLQAQETPMTRSLGIERVFNLGDYKSIRFNDFINNLPEKVALNNELVDSIRYLQLVNVELHYRQYVQLAKKIDKFGVNMQEAIDFLQSEKATTLEDIKTIFKKE